MKKSLRVKTKEDFQKVMTSKFKLNSKNYVIYYLKKDQETPRWGISASKKLGGAITRVKVRRQVRAMVDSMQKSLEIMKYDYVIIVRNNYLNNNYIDNLNDLTNLFKKIGGLTNEK